MPRWLRTSLKILATLVALLVLLWLGIAVYVNINKDVLLEQITAQLNESLNGTLMVENMEPTLVRGLPGISLSLKNVVLRDSLYPTHRRNLLQAKDIYVSVNAFSILSGEPRIRNVRISDGEIYMFTDGSGYSNTNIFKKSDNKATAPRKGGPRINHLFLQNIHFTFENKSQLKLFITDINKMEVRVHYNDTGWRAGLDVQTFVKSFAFNTNRGSFLKNKQLDADLTLVYNKTTKTLSVPEQNINIGEDAITIAGQFFFAATPSSFRLDIDAKNILLKNASSMLSPNISSKIEIVDLKKELDAHATLHGDLTAGDDPSVYVTWIVKDNTLLTPGGEISDCSFTGLFTNQVAEGRHNDINSGISLHGLNGRWHDIPFSADTIKVSNLIRPVIEGRFQSRFSLTKLNPVIGGETFVFNTGNVSLSLLYKGGLLADDTIAPYIFGDVKVTGASMTYLPRNLSFTQAGAVVSFKGSDVFVHDANVKSGTNVLRMNGSLRNFLSLYYTEPAKIVFDWNIYSKKIDINEFRVFLAPRGTVRVSDKPQPVSKVTPMSRQLEKVLALSSVRMRLKVDQVLYREFTAANFDADIQLEETAARLNNISLNHAGGKLELYGNIEQKGAVNDFNVIANIQNVHIAGFFKSFENFGQDAITDKNIRGRLYANVNMSGRMTDEGKIAPRSFKGTVDFDLQDGALVDFEPFRKVGKYVFRNRNLSNVTFGDIKNKLEINGDKFTINPMLLQSSALNMNIRGVYSLSGGTDIDIDVPLRNPKKDEIIPDDSLNFERSMKGIVIHLKAVDGDDGNVKIQLMRKRQETETKKKRSKKK